MNLEPEACFVRQEGSPTSAFVGMTRAFVLPKMVEDQASGSGVKVEGTVERPWTRPRFPKLAAQLLKGGVGAGLVRKAGVIGCSTVKLQASFGEGALEAGHQLGGVKMKEVGKREISSKKLQARIGAFMGEAKEACFCLMDSKSASEGLVCESLGGSPSSTRREVSSRPIK